MSDLWGQQLGPDGVTWSRPQFRNECLAPLGAPFVLTPDKCNSKLTSAVWRTILLRLALVLAFANHSVIMNWSGVIFGVMSSPSMNVGARGHRSIVSRKGRLLSLGIALKPRSTLFRIRIDFKCCSCYWLVRNENLKNICNYNTSKLCKNKQSKKERKFKTVMTFLIPAFLAFTSIEWGIDTRCKNIKSSGQRSIECATTL